MAAQVAAAADHIAAASRTSGLTITLGGDHFVAYPATLGVVTALRERRPGVRLAYLHIDSHTDFVDFHHQTGRMHHGSAARRVSEIPELTSMAWFGVNAMTQPNQVAVMYDRGFRVATASYVETVGPADAMSRVLDYLLDGTDALYVSIDIDVVNSSDAPATSAPGFRGISARALIEALDVVARVPGLVGLDLCEVNPEFDLSGRTEQLAVDALLAVISHRIFERVGELPAEQLAAVLFTPDAMRRRAHYGWRSAVAASRGCRPALRDVPGRATGRRGCAAARQPVTESNRRSAARPPERPDCGLRKAGRQHR